MQNAVCPKCGKVIDQAADVDNENCAPKEGDISLCFYCGEILKFAKNPFGKGLAYTLPDKHELDDMLKDNPQIIQLQRKIRSIRR